MRRFLLWVLMVILFVFLIVGGALGFLYLRTGPDDLPAPQAAMGEITLEPNGYEWDLPIMGGVLNKNYMSAPSLGAQDLGTVDQLGAALHLPAWASGAEIEVECGGRQIFSGDAHEYASFAWPENGDYRMSIRVLNEDASARPARPLGWYSYSVKFHMERTVSAVLSSTKLPQGGVFAIYAQSSSSGEPPTAECELGRVWFAPYAAGWIGFLPSAYNAESGVYPVNVTVDGQTVPLEVEVTFRDYPDAEPPESEPEEPGAAQEYRDEIWPLYTDGAAEKRWDGAFTQPVQGSVLLDYGVYLKGGGRSGGVTFAAEKGAPVVSPADGTVEFSAPLLLTGNTVVVEHGCGVKSYFYHLDTLELTPGSTVKQGETLGFAGEEPVICELKIGNKSIDPWAAWKGTSGLFYRPNFGKQ